MLAEDADALYVCFIGTKQRRDIVTNANIMQDVLWPDLSWDSSAGSQVSVHNSYRTCFEISINLVHYCFFLG